MKFKENCWIFKSLASSSLTCTAITSSGVTSHPTDIYSAAVIATISASDFKTCISYFGDSTNNYNSAQLAALATLVQVPKFIKLGFQN